VHRSIPDPVGLWEPDKGRTIIKRSQLAYLAYFAGTLLHEITHARTGFSDVSRAFELALTDVLGTVVAANYAHAQAS
jgi:positive regulator of sigma E activity